MRFIMYMVMAQNKNLMLRRTIPFLAQCVLAMCMSGSSSAQNNEADNSLALSPIEIEVGVDIAEAHIGDLITYTLTITYDTSIQLFPPPIGANMGAFDVKDYDIGEPEDIDGGRSRLTSWFKLSTFTTGEYIIPPIPIGYTENGIEKAISSDIISIKIKSLLDENSDSAEIKPLRGPISYPISRMWLYLTIAGIIVALAVSAYFYLKRKRLLEEGEFVDLRPPWEVAYERLARLENSNYLSREEFKTFYTELTETLREFLGKIFGEPTLDLTTEELLNLVQERSTPEEWDAKISTTLHQADLVKFARVVPAEGRPALDFAATHEIITYFKSAIEARQRQEELQRQAALRAGSESNETENDLQEIIPEAISSQDSSENVSREFPKDVSTDTSREDRS